MNTKIYSICFYFCTPSISFRNYIQFTHCDKVKQESFKLFRFNWSFDLIEECPFIVIEMCNNRIRGYMYSGETIRFEMSTVDTVFFSKPIGPESILGEDF